MTRESALDGLSIPESTSFEVQLLGRGDLGEMAKETCLFPSCHT